ncbi:MAG: OsmC family protein [Saprospiraceae bacterium]|nr:OsmC family protein [Saprospiraceae bacterium]
MPYTKVSFKNANGITLKGKLEFPLTRKPEAYAIFAHVFTGHKNLIGAKHISRALTLSGLAVLRFDFTGLGESDGDFSDTNFSSNVTDIKAAAKFLEENYQSPSVIVGQSLGGAASIFAADEIESVRAVATIGAPSEPEHVTHLLGCKIEDIEKEGKAEVTIGGRPFTIKRHFLDDLRKHNMFQKIKKFRKALLILHSPQDEIVEIENAAKIYHAAFHPKSFVTLDEADHMLTNKNDAFYSGQVISSWVKRYIDVPDTEVLKTDKQVIVKLGNEGYTTEIMAGRHAIIADESESLGGNDFGPSPYELLNASLGACTAMTLQMYARRKKWDLQEVRVHLDFKRSYKEDCEACPESDRRIDKFEKVIEMEGDLTDGQRQRLLEIANKCPIHRTLAGSPQFITHE